MRAFLKVFFTFLGIVGGVALAVGLFGVELSHANYWDHHGVLFLLGLAAFPRITLFLSTVASGGILWWLAWLFAPRILVAILATLAYWYVNPILVLVAWLVALGGESSEKHVFVQRVQVAGRGRAARSRKGFANAKEF